MFSRLKPFFNLILTIFIAYNVYLASFFALNGEMHLTSDIGRDFLLLQELDQKKLVLIGPRTNAQGIYHGPLWTYLNYPAYLTGNGNPVTVAWFWVFIGVVYLSTTFILFRKIIGTTSSLLATSILSVAFIFTANNNFGQITTIYFMPYFLYTIYKYIGTKKMKYLLLHFIMIGIIFHMNVGVGILIGILSAALTVFLIIKNKQWIHLTALLVLPLVLANFIIFDFRHDLNMTKAILNMGGSKEFIIPLNSWIQNRVEHLISMQIFTRNAGFLTLITFVLIMVFTFLEIKYKSRLKNLFLLLIFYYFGYMLLTYFNKGILLIDHVYPLTAISAIWLAALSSGRYKNIFILLILIILVFNFLNAFNFTFQSQNTYIGKNPDSWTTLKNVAQYVTGQQKDKEFGYFVYSPDSYAYQQRYAMGYVFKNAKARSMEYAKKPVTYVIAARPPKNNPYMKEEWWIKNEAKINEKPAEIKQFPGGYKVYKFNLSASSQNIPHDPNIELGIHFR